jgi:cell division protein FtsQ
MTSISSNSQADLNQRRRMLRNSRRLKMLLSLWQILAVSGLLGGLVWATTQPNWILRDSHQVIIEGNHLLPERMILSFLPLKYPRSLLQISPEAIARTLESHAPIADVTVTRKIFPPSLIVQVQERVPVAIAITKLSPGSSSPHPKAAVGFLAQDGMWIPLSSYPPEIRQLLRSPDLKVIGLPEYYRPYWTSLYQAVNQSPVKVIEIDCQDPTNLILKTELGIVHLGPYTPRLTEQLKVLAQMRNLSKQTSSSQIAYINLKNPKIPSVQMYQIPKAETSGAKTR